jgi:hypothetical protein
LLIARQRLRGTSKLGLELLYLRLQRAQFGARIGWRHERAGTEPGALLADRLVVPHCQRAGHLQAIHCIFVPRLELVGRLVSLDSQCVKQIADFWRQRHVALQFEQQVRLRRFAAEVNAEAHGQILRQGFSQLAQLHEGGVWIACENLLGGAPELGKQRRMLSEKTKIACLRHVPVSPFPL